MIEIAYSDRYVLDLPEGHRFPMIKYELVKEQLEYEGLAQEGRISDPGLIDEDIILETHTSEYWNNFKTLKLSPKEFRKIGFPASEKLVLRSRSSSMGTLHATKSALINGLGMNIAGGTHHAYSNRGEAFCMLNDIAISSNYLLNRNLAQRILIVDLDVHQGNGTAEIFRHDKRVFTFSMHGAGNYPLHKEQSDLDIPLPPKTTDEEYLKILRDTLPKLITQHQPDFIFYQAGVDALHTDKLGTLSMTKNGLKQRDEFVYEQCLKNNLPVVVTMGGGYSVRVADIVDAHCNTFRLAFQLFG